MALVLVMYLPVLFERLRNIRKTDTKHSDEYIRGRVERIYFDVTHFYNQLGALRDDVGGPEVWPDFDHLFCSKAWNEVVDNAPEHCIEAVGNYWLGGLCNLELSHLGFLYANKVEVIDYTGDQGTVSLLLHNDNEVVSVLLNMVFERDDWFIDNMTFNWKSADSVDVVGRLLVDVVVDPVVKE
jgi:hypothetical protein